MTAASRKRLLIGAIVAAAVAAVLAGLATMTQWEDIEVPRSLSGAAARDEHYALERLAAALGAHAVDQERLEPMPPAHATLLLESWSFGTFPQRDRGLRAWVEGGGHLVMGYWDVAGLRGEGGEDVSGASSWIPVRQIEARRKGSKKPPAVPAAPAQASRGADDPAPGRGTRAQARRSVLPEPICQNEHEPPGLAPAYAAGADAAPAVPDTGPAPAAAPGDAGSRSDPEEDEEDETDRSAAAPGAAPADAVPEPATALPGLRLCSFTLAGPGLEAAAPLWGLRDAGGLRVVRLAVGAGTVTVVQDLRIFDNRNLFYGDNGLIDAAALQLRAGAELWIAAGDGRQQVLGWLWTRAPVVPLGGALVLGLWLWRALPRFGPREERAALARRSMIEQIRGTARFLWQRSPATLHAAQRRALDEAAARHIRDYARLDLGDRVEAIARRTGLGRGALLQAFAIDRPPDRRSLPRQLAVLEAARRALQPPAPSGTPNPQTPNPQPWSKKT